MAMRNQSIRILLTDDERTEITQQAAKSGLCMSAYIRLAVMEKMNATKD